MSPSAPQAPYSPPAAADWGLLLWPASLMIAGTSGSSRKLWKPASSQSKSTQIRSSWLGSRNTVAPLDPCSFRFSAPFVEKIFENWSKSSTVVVARNIGPPFKEVGRTAARGEGRTCAVRPTLPGSTRASKGRLAGERRSVRGRALERTEHPVRRALGLDLDAHVVGVAPLRPRSDAHGMAAEAVGEVAAARARK